jgi:hypothetical protein
MQLPRRGSAQPQTEPPPADVSGQGEERGSRIDQHRRATYQEELKGHAGRDRDEYQQSGVAQ